MPKKPEVLRETVLLKIYELYGDPDTRGFIVSNKSPNEVANEIVNGTGIDLNRLNFMLSILDYKNGTMIKL